MTTVKPMTEAHLEAVVGLCRELGYEAGAAGVASRFEAFADDTGSGLFVAEDADGTVQGFVHIFHRPMLEAPPPAQVQALVVGAAHRRKGVGLRLMEAAESWAKEKGISQVVLYSLDERVDTHAFYTRSGYKSLPEVHKYAKSPGGLKDGAKKK